jgi:hypothetical protein
MNIKKTLTVTALAAALAAGGASTPALATGGGGNDGWKPSKPAAEKVLKQKNVAKQKAENYSYVEQGSVKAGTKSFVFYGGINQAEVDQDIDQDIDNTNESVSTAGASNGKGPKQGQKKQPNPHSVTKQENRSEQKAENNSYVEQGTVKALPHSTVWYYGYNYADVDQDIDQDADNTNK